MTNKYLYLLVISLSAFFVFSFAPYLIFPLGIISVAGLSYVFSKIQTKKNLIISSLLSSLVISILGMYWIIYASEYSFGSYAVGVLVLIGFSLLYSVFIFFISVPIFISNKKGIFYYFVLVLSWSSADAFKFYFLGGFPWFISAYMWSFSLEIIQIVSIIGIMGLSICTYALIFSILFLFYKDNSIYLRISLVSIFFVLFLSFYVYGKHRINILNNLKTEKEISIRLVQTNVPQERKMNFYDMRSYSQDLINEAMQPNNDRIPDIIFLPEASFVFLSQTDVDDIVKKIPQGSYLVAGGMRFDNYNNIYNSVISFNDKGYNNHYDKNKLVPFGEKTPFSDYFPNLLNFVGLSNFSSGSEIKIFNIINVNFIINICFEGLFPLEGINIYNIDFILNSANEGWFNNSIELKQNWDIYRYRSIETGLPSIKVSNTGVTGIIDLSGRVILEVPAFKKINTDTLLGIKKSKTIYSYVNYNAINYILILLYSMAILFLLKKKI